MSRVVPAAELVDLDPRNWKPRRSSATSGGAGLMKRTVLGVLFVAVAVSPLAAAGEVPKAVADAWPAK